MATPCAQTTLALACHFAKAPFAANGSLNKAANMKPLLACPSVASLHQLAPSQSLPRHLLRLLRGHKIAILGDSMSRQLFSTLVGVLRGQEAFLDPSTWHPARYSLRLEAEGRCTRDDLNLFWRPDPTLTERAGSVRYRVSERESELESERVAISERIVVDWIMLPRFEPLWAVANGLRLLRASHGTRPYTLAIFFVPAAWHTREESEKQMAHNQSVWPIPQAFWELLRIESERMAPNGTRFAAITMPTEHIVCSKDDAWRAHVHDQCALHGRCGRTDSIKRRAAAAEKRASYLKMSPTGGSGGNRSLSAAQAGVRACLAHTCCRRAMVAYRNEFEGLPNGWARLDFAALTNATLPPSLGWHYECQLTPPHAGGESGVRECAERAMRLKFDSCNARYAKWFAAEKTMPGVVRHAQAGFACREAGNTAFWRHIAHAHWSLFERTSGAPRA